MSRTVFNYRVSIDAKPEEVYAYVADLTRHGEWSKGLTIEAVSEGPVEVGSQYRSRGRMMGKEFQNDISVADLNPPGRFRFIANDGKSDVSQEFTLSPQNEGTLLVRRVAFEVNPVMGFVFKAVIGPLIANPSMNKSLKSLKERLEQPK